MALFPTGRRKYQIKVKGFSSLGTVMFIVGMKVCKF